MKFNGNTTDLVKILQYMYPQTCKMGTYHKHARDFPGKAITGKDLVDGFKL